MDTTLFDLFYKSTGICTDTRAIDKDCLFICIKGENFDGNKFASQALESGALHVIVDNEEYFVDKGNMTLVSDSVVYLQQLANFHRNKFDIPVIGITGSNGKTTTKELINTVLSKKYNVLATKGNLNNHLGVPFTLLRLNSSHDIAIIEMGANRYKDIEELCKIAEPNFGVITNIGKAHLEGFQDFAGVLRTKRELYESVEHNNGKIIINGDDEVLTAALPIHVDTRAYGTGKSTSVRGELVELNPFVCMKWNTDDYSSPTLETKMIGKYNFYNYLCAITFGVEFDVSSTDIDKAIQEYEPENRRSQVKKTSRNTLILDCYNANPSSMKSALESFAANSSPLEKLVFLGEMKELGIESRAEHEKIIQLMEELGLRGYFVGKEFEDIQSDSVLRHFNDNNELIKALDLENFSDYLILLKGSRSVKLEELEDQL